jgi:SIR2-like domain
VTITTLAGTSDATVLRDLRRSGHLIPFIGAGLSAAFKLPTWSELIDKVAEQLGYDPRVFRLCGNNYQLAEYYVAVKGSIGPLRSEMDRLFDVPDDAIRISRSHNALVDMRLPVIYTTNYDRILERAHELREVPWHTVASIDDMSTAPANATQVVKFHGTFENDASLVLTESSYFERLAFESALDIKLRADMLGRCLLFIGYSLNDINIRYMLYKLHKLRHQVDAGSRQMPSAYLATFTGGEVQRTLLARWDVSMIELDPIDKVHSTATFLESLV